MQDNNPKTPTLSHSRRDLLQVAKATSLGIAMSSVVPSLASSQQAQPEPFPTAADDLPGLNDQSVKPVHSQGSLRRDSRYLVDVHVHVGKRQALSRLPIRSAAQRTG
jgi:hypothetical protein